MQPLLNFQSYGQTSAGATLVLLHGLFGQAANLGSMARDLARDFRVLVPDLRNHGRSFHASVMNYQVMAGDIVDLMDANSIGSAALLGHSMGGKVAMQLALDQPARVERLVVGDIAPVAYAPHHAGVFAALRHADQPSADRRETQRLLEQHLHLPEVVALLLMNRARRDDGSWFWRFNVDAISASYANILAAPLAATPCALQALFIHGERSDYITAAHAEAARRLFPNAHFRMMADTGHWLHAEKPQLFLQWVREFLGATS